MFFSPDSNSLPFPVVQIEKNFEKREKMETQNLWQNVFLYCLLLNHLVVFRFNSLHLHRVGVYVCRCHWKHQDTLHKKSEVSEQKGSDRKSPFFAVKQELNRFTFFSSCQKSLPVIHSTHAEYDTLSFLSSQPWLIKASCQWNSSSVQNDVRHLGLGNESIFTILAFQFLSYYDHIVRSVLENPPFQISDCQKHVIKKQDYYTIILLVEHRTFISLLICDIVIYCLLL